MSAVCVIPKQKFLSYYIPFTFYIKTDGICCHSWWCNIVFCTDVLFLLELQTAGNVKMPQYQTCTGWHEDFYIFLLSPEKWEICNHLALLKSFNFIMFEPNVFKKTNWKPCSKCLSDALQPQMILNTRASHFGRVEPWITKSHLVHEIRLSLKQNLGTTYRVEMSTLSASADYDIVLCEFSC